MLLYCEVENFQSKLTDRGYHTALKGRYQIFDASGNVVAEKDLSLKEEHCQNKRRDFFIPYFVWMPKQCGGALSAQADDRRRARAANGGIDDRFCDQGKIGPVLLSRGARCWQSSRRPT